MFLFHFYNFESSRQFYNFYFVSYGGITHLETVAEINGKLFDYEGYNGK